MKNIFCCSVGAERRDDLAPTGQDLRVYFAALLRYNAYGVAFSNPIFAFIGDLNAKTADSNAEFDDFDVRFAYFKTKIAVFDVKTLIFKTKLPCLNIKITCHHVLPSFYHVICPDKMFRTYLYQYAELKVRS